MKEREMLSEINYFLITLKQFHQNKKKKIGETKY